MDTNQKLITLDMKTKLSTLWVFGLLNMIIRDIHQLFKPGVLAEMMTGTVNGVQMTDGTLLLSGIMIEVVIAMVFLSRVMTYRFNRWVNIVVGIGAIGLVLGVGGPKDLDDIFFAAVQILSLLLIIYYAWSWPKQEA